MNSADYFIAGFAHLVAFVLYGLGYLHGRGHRFVDRIFGRDA